MNPEFVLKGAVLSLRATKQYLRDAVTLFHADAHAGACVLATIALEHLGQCGWLVRQWSANSKLSELSCDHFKKRLERDHCKKIDDGLMTLTTPIPASLAKVTERLAELTPTHPDYAGLAEQWEMAHQKMRRNAPNRFHTLRVRAQYVDPRSDCGDWASPLEVKKEQAGDLLLNVANSYRTFLLLTLEKQFPAFMKIVDDMGIRSELEDTTGVWP